VVLPSPQNCCSKKLTWKASYPSQPLHRRWHILKRRVALRSLFAHKTLSRCIKHVFAATRLQQSTADCTGTQCSIHGVNILLTSSCSSKRSHTKYKYSFCAFRFTYKGLYPHVQKIIHVTILICNRLQTLLPNSCAVDSRATVKLCNCQTMHSHVR
jgi:hypothetical protein